MSVSRDNYLCHICSAIDFDNYTFESHFLHRRLGTWGKILQSSKFCRFCRLVEECVVRRALPKVDDDLVLTNEKSWKLCATTLHYDERGSRHRYYTNEWDLKDTGARAKGLSAFRLVIKWDGCSDTNPAQIQYIAKHDDVDRRHFHGRLIRRDQVQWDLLRSWVSLCDRYHKFCNHGPSKSPFSLPDGFRLIDVQTMCVVEMPKGVVSDYVVLSYVWGEKHLKRQLPKLRSRNVYCTSSGYQWANLPRHLPRTIVDAIQVTRELRYRFLWVDALCIIQDDDADKGRQLGNMDAIYSLATLTIAAGFGKHAEKGLPGVSISRPTPQITEKIHGLTYAVCCTPFSELYGFDSDLEWSKRAWTFQEKVLSRRLLLFTGEQVYFKCSATVWSEEVHSEYGWLSRDLRRRDEPLLFAPLRQPRQINTFFKLFDILTMEHFRIRDKGKIPKQLLYYANAVHEYTTRDLSNPEDTVVAIRGILRVLGMADSDTPAGMPIAHLPTALLWIPEPGLKYSCRDIGKIQAPTWSWARWELEGCCVWTSQDLEHTQLYDHSQPLLLLRQGLPKRLVSSVEGPRNENAEHKKRVAALVAELKSRQMPRALKEAGSLLFLKAHIATFRVGQKLKIKHGMDMSKYEHVGGCWAYQLLNDASQCVGEVWTSKDMSNQTFPFIAISRGKGLYFARPESRFIPKRAGPTHFYLGDSKLPLLMPRMFFDVGLPLPRYIPVSKYLMLDLQQKRLKWTIPGPKVGGVTPVFGMVEEKRSKWEVVNLLMADFDGDVATRLGVGKVLADVWDGTPKASSYVLLA
ncbi:Heterokaryon incompatibility protein (HET) domain containing protein [Rhypophila decipiens]